MAEEQLNTEQQEVPMEPQQQQQQEELSIEDRAREMGWRPKEEYKGTKPWRSAETFVELKDFYDKIEEQSKIIKSMKSEVERDRESTRKFMSDYQAGAIKAAEERFNAQLAALREDKKLALREGETDRVVEIDDQIAEIREQKRVSSKVELPKQVIDTQEVNQYHEKVQEFVSRNKWYESNDDMRDWADSKARRYAGQGLNGDQVLARIEKEVKDVFPQQFRNSNRDKPSAVEGSSAAGSTSSKGIPSDMSDFERQIMKSVLETTPRLTEAEYIKQWKKARG